MTKGVLPFPVRQRQQVYRDPYNTARTGKSTELIDELRTAEVVLASGASERWPFQALGSVAGSLSRLVLKDTSQDHLKPGGAVS